MLFCFHIRHRSRDNGLALTILVKTDSLSIFVRLCFYVAIRVRLDSHWSN